MTKLLATMVTIACAATGWLPASAYADSYPKQKPIDFIVGYAAGGSTDIIARLIGPKLGEQLGQTLVVQNRPGASGALAAEMLVRAPSDGYTIMACTNTILTTHKYLYKNLRYDPKDILPVTQISVIPYVVLVNSSFPASNVKELLAVARQKPGVVTFGSSGQGSAGHLAVNIFAAQTGVKLNHVPYRGSGASMIDLAAGQIDMGFDQEATVAPFIASGKIKALAIAGSQRSPTMPQVPTLNELGVPFEAASWTGICLKAGTDPAIVSKVREATAKVMGDPAIKARFVQLGMQPKATSTQEVQAIVSEESMRMGKIITSLGISLD